MMVQFTQGGASESTMDAIKSIRKCMNKNMFMSGVSTIMYDTKALADAQAPLYVVIAIALALIVLMFTLNRMSCRLCFLWHCVPRLYIIWVQTFSSGKYHILHSV